MAMRVTANRFNYAIDTDFESADPGLSPNPYTTVTVAGGNTMAKEAVSPSNFQTITFAGASADAYGRTTFAASLNPAIAQVRARFKFFASALPYASGSNVGNAIFRLDHSGGTSSMLSLFTWRDGSGNHIWRMSHIPSGTAVSSVTQFTAGVQHDVQIVIDGTKAGSENAKLFVDRELLITIDRSGNPFESASAVTLGSRSGSAIPSAGVVYRMADLSVFHQVRRGSRARALGIGGGMRMGV